MASALLKIYVHVVFHVKAKGVNMQKRDLPEIFSYIAGIVRRIGGEPIAVGGVEDHVHILAAMPKSYTVPDYVKEIKIGSSHWLRINKLGYTDFAWQTGYGAFSVSASVLPKIQSYVMRQEEHHSRQTYSDEYRKWLVAYKVEFDERYAFSD